MGVKEISSSAVTERTHTHTPEIQQMANNKKNNSQIKMFNIFQCGHFYYFTFPYEIYGVYDGNSVVNRGTQCADRDARNRTEMASQQSSYPTNILERTSRVN